MARTRKLLTISEADYLSGLADGRKSAAGCNDQADISWHQRVVFDNLWATRPRYVAGFIDGFAA